MVAALETVFGKGNVEVHDDPVALIGYHGDDRSKLPKTNLNYAPKVHVCVRRRFVGGSANDVGFRRNEEGGYEAYVSEFDSTGNFNKAKQNRVNQEYTLSVSEKKLRQSGYQVKRVPQKNGVWQIVASKWK